MQLLSACGEREMVDAIFHLVPLDEALRCSLCWSSREAAGQRAAAVSVRVTYNYFHTLHIGNPNPPLDSVGYRYPCRKTAMWVSHLGLVSGSGLGNGMCYGTCYGTHRGTQLFTWTAHRVCCVCSAYSIQKDALALFTL